MKYKNILFASQGNLGNPGHRLNSKYPLLWPDRITAFPTKSNLLAIILFFCYKVTIGLVYKNKQVEEREKHEKRRLHTL
jgi:hypothetical protein